MYKFNKEAPYSEWGKIPGPFFNDYMESTPYKNTGSMVYYSSTSGDKSSAGYSGKYDVYAWNSGTEAKLIWSPGANNKFTTPQEAINNHKAHITPKW